MKDLKDYQAGLDITPQAPQPKPAPSTLPIPDVTTEPSRPDLSVPPDAEKKYLDQEIELQGLRNQLARLQSGKTSILDQLTIGHFLSGGIGIALGSVGALLLKGCL